MNHPTIMFRKEAIIRAGSYTSMNYFEDYYLWLICKSKDYTFYNLDYPSVAMKRESNVARRHGLKYGFYELRFISLCLIQRLVPFYNFLIMFLRVVLRIIPNLFLKILYKYDKQRTGFVIDENLNEYIKKLNQFKFKYEKN